MIERPSFIIQRDAMSKWWPRTIRKKNPQCALPQGFTTKFYGQTEIVTSKKQCASCPRYLRKYPLPKLSKRKCENTGHYINPNSLAPFFVSSLSPRKGRGQKMGVPPGFRTGDPPHHNALFTHGTPPGCRCPGSDFVPIWDPLLWRNRT